MLQIFKEPNFDFLGMRRIWLGISAAAIVASLALLATRGLNYGIEFTGGTEVQIRYSGAPNVGAIRSNLSAAGFAGALVTTIGDPEDHEVYVRIPLVGDEEQADLGARVIEALRTEDAEAHLAAGRLNVNTAERAAIESLLATLPGATAESAAALAKAILERRNDVALFATIDDLASIEGMTPEAMEVLRARAFAGSFAIRGQSYIGPVIGQELVKKAIWAILGSLLGILVYIWIRFEFQWGLAAVIALVHDSLVTLGLFSAFQFEMSLPVVASFLTLIGYSVNDTVVIFDRVRENLRNRTGPPEYDGLLNFSINQTLNRTILTSLLTWFVCLSLFLFGGEVLRAFSFVLTVGVIVGSYSTIYIASPVLLAWRRWIAGRKAAKAAAPSGGTARRAARKVRSAGGD